MNVIVVRAGFLTTVQDLGRIGSRQFGISSGGALDTHALRVANLMVGNDEAAAGLEIAMGGSRIRFQDQRVVAWCGGEFDVNVPAGHAAMMSGGEEIVFNQPKGGCRSWLAISGGIDVPVMLSSRSTDLRGHFGGLAGRALRDGDELSLGGAAVSATAEKISSWSAMTEWTQPAKAEPTLRVIRGAGWGRFQNPTALLRDTFSVTPDSNRMGARLEGPELPRNDDVDLISEAVAPGTIQVPPSGQPMVLLGDCQTVGGYPKIAHVITTDLPIAAQLRAGDRVQFREVSLENAHRFLVKRERDLQQFRVGISLRRS